jgi:cation:H+ antiporter
VLTALQVIGALLLLVVCSDAFTNSVEWIGELLDLSRSAVGSVIAAVGSSLPETMIAAVALLVLHDRTSTEIGIGAVIGAPFMLGTLAFALIGVIASLRSRPSRPSRALGVRLDATTFGLALFVLTFALVVGASFAPAPLLRVAVSIIVIGAYLGYLAYHLRLRDEASDMAPPPLRLAPRTARPSPALVIVQFVAALVLTIVASRLFIASLGAISAAFGISAIVVSLILSPIATELPELMNVTIWMRRGFDELALGNVIGAMMFQTSIGSSIAMLASPWHLDRMAYGACAAAFAGALLVLAVTWIRRRVEPAALVACSLFYAGYIVYAFASRSLP